MRTVARPGRRNNLISVRGLFSIGETSPISQKYSMPAEGTPLLFRQPPRLSGPATGKIPRLAVKKFL